MISAMCSDALGNSVDRVDAQRREAVEIVLRVFLGQGLRRSIPSSLAASISLSSTSVMLTTHVTSKPL